jgi:hypothetical protein
MEVSKKNYMMMFSMKKEKDKQKEKQKKRTMCKRGKRATLVENEGTQTFSTKISSCKQKKMRKF